MIKQLKLNLLIDILMFILILFCMSYSLIGTKTHEYLGIFLCVLFIIHCFNHKKYYFALFHFNYNLNRLIFSIINLGTLLTMIGLIISSLIFLNYIPDIYNLNLTSFARTVHLLSAYWSFLFISLHLGLHWQMLYKILLNHLPIAMNKILQAFPQINIALSMIISLYGLICFFNYDLWSYMSYQNNFVFFNPNQSTILFILDYLSISALFITTTHYVLKFLSLNKVVMIIKEHQ